MPASSEAKVISEVITRFSGVSNLVTLQLDGKIVNFSTGFLSVLVKMRSPGLELRTLLKTLERCLSFINRRRNGRLRTVCSESSLTLAARVFSDFWIEFMHTCPFLRSFC
jgi:hypothetical protein